MKKKLFAMISAVAVLAALLVGLCACANTFGPIKSALEDKGYQEIELKDEYKDQVKELYGDAGERATVHVFQKSILETALIVEFKSNDDLVEALRDRLTEEEIEDAYNALQKLDIVNGNCVIVSVAPEALAAFKSTKG